MGVNPEMVKFMLLSREEANRCKVDPPRTRGAASLVYSMGSKKLCVIELFREDKGTIEKNCQGKVLAETVLPQAISITDRVWMLATRVALEFSEVWDGKGTRTIRIIPPIDHGSSGHWVLCVRNFFFISHHFIELRKSSRRERLLWN